MKKLSNAMGKLLLEISAGRGWHGHRRATWSRTVAALRQRGLLNERWGFTDAPDHGLSADGVRVVELLKSYGVPDAKQPMSEKQREVLLDLHKGMTVGQLLTCTSNLEKTIRGLRRRGFVSAPPTKLTKAGWVAARKLVKARKACVQRTRAQMEES